MPFSPRSPVPPAPAPGQPAPSRRVAVVIWTALLLGVCVFAGVAIALAPLNPARNGSELGSLFLVVAAALAAVNLPLSFVLPRRMRAPPGTTPEAFALTKMIVGCALAEGTALACIVFYLVSGEPLLLALLVACLAVLARWFPSEARWARLAQRAGTPGGGAGPPRRSLVRE